MENLQIGNLYAQPNGDRGWIIGHFMDPRSVFHSNEFEVKWGKHAAGEKKDASASTMTAKSLVILAYGKFRLDFPTFGKNMVMEKEGDYAFYEAGIPHSWEALEDCLVITVRWPSAPNT